MVSVPSSFLFFFSFFSPKLSRRRLDVCHTSTHGVALVRIYDAGLKRAARGSLKIQDAKKSPKIRHLRTIAQICRAISSQLRHVSTIGKNLVKQPTCPNMVNFGLLAAEMLSLVWGTPSVNFNGFHVLASLLQPRRSTEANQTLHDVWPSPARLQYIYSFGGCCPVTEFCQVQNSVCVLQGKSCALLLAAILHGTRAVGSSQTLRH